MDPTRLDLITMAVAMPLAAGIPALLPRVPIPGVVVEIVLGVLVGPQVLDLIHPGPTLNLLASFGFAMLFLMAGFELDPATLRGRPIRNGAIGWALTAVLALAAAATLRGVGLASDMGLTALALATTAIGSLMPVLRDTGALAPPYGPLVLAAGAMGEVGPVIALSLVLAGHRAPVQAGILLVFIAAATVAVIATTRISGGGYARVVERTIRTSGQLPLRLAIGLLILLAVLSQELRVDTVLAAFVVGAIARASVQRHHDEAFSARLDGIGSAFMIPIFFIMSGVRLDVAALFSHPAALAMVPLYAVLMLATRGLPVLLLYRSDLPIRRRLALALHSGTQLSLVVAITGIAVRDGMMPGSQGAALVGGGIVTLILFPALARPLLKNPTPH
jgi:Kef-type K+ transport system membrane component KefB